MKVVKTILIVLLVIVMLAGIAAGAYMFFALRDKGPEPDDVADSVIALCDEVSLKGLEAGDEGVKAYLKEKEADDEKQREEEEKRKKEEEGDEDDPENYDSTEDTGKNASADEMMQRYIGTWDQQGIIVGSGDLDTSSGSYCTYVFKSDFSYTAKGVDVNGKKIKEEGTWKLNANKQIVAGDYTMGIDDSGYLLKDTGERDGKGRKMKYAFAKS